MKDLVTKGAEHFGIYIDETTAEKFDLYYKSVVSYNEKVNLTAITDETEFCVKHFLDSIAAAKFLPENAKLVDVGSGAGYGHEVVIGIVSIQINFFRTGGNSAH